MTPLIKGVIGLGGIGIISGGGFFISSVINKKPENNVTSALQKDKFTILNLDTAVRELQESKWQTIFKSYSALTADKSNLKIENLTLSSTEDKHKGINKLKTSCLKLLRTKRESLDFNKNYKLASQWCVEPISISDLLKRRGVTYLDTIGSTNSKEWEDMAKKYGGVQSATNKPLKEVEWTQVNGDNYSDNANKIKSACGTRKTKGSNEEGFLDFLAEAQTWCSTNSLKPLPNGVS